MYRVGLLCSVALGVFSPAGAQTITNNCASIQEPTQRLECYDKTANQPVKPATPKKPAAAAANQTELGTVTDTGWQLRKSKGSFDDKVSCVISPIGKPYIQFTRGDLYIGYKGRGGINGFRYRIDDQPASEMQLPSPIEKQIGALRLTGGVFSQIVSASRLRISTLTLVAGIDEEDLNLAGLRKLYSRLQRECQN